MLQAIRDRVTGIVAIFILGLLAVPFVFFGLESYIRDIPQDAVATVGDSEITATEFQSEFARYRSQLRQRQGEAYDDLAANSPEARREFLESMIEQRLLIQHATDMGMAISPNTIAEVLRDIPAFQVDGNFDFEIYRQRLSAGGQSPSSFERDLARDLLAQELPAAVSASSLVTEADVDRWLTVQNERRNYAAIVVPSAPLRDAVEITDADIEAFYNDNTGQFMRPEQIEVEYVELDTRAMAETLEIDEETLRQRYEATRERFMTAERRRAAHILIDAGQRPDDEARALAASLRERVESGESFADLAAEYSDDPASADDGGDLGWIEPGVMMPAFEEALFELAPGEVSAPVETEFGWHLIRLEEIEAPRGQSFAEARDEIAAEVREERAEDLYIEQSDRLVDLIYADPTGLDAVAADLGLELKTAGPYSRSSAEGVLADPRVMEAAFSDLVLVERQASEPIEIDPNHAVVVRVTEHYPPEPRPLADVRDEIRERLVGERAREAARQRAEELLARLQAGDADLEAMAEAEGLEIDQREVTRRSFEVGSQLLEALFELPMPAAEGGPVHDVLARGADWLVVRLDEVVPGRPDQADDAQRMSARQQIRFARASLELQGLIDWLRDSTEISVVEDGL